SNLPPILGAAAVVVLGAGTWFAMHGRKTAPPPPAAATPTVPAQIAATGAPAPVSVQAPQTTQSAAAGAASTATASVATGKADTAVPTVAKPSPGTPAKSTASVTPAAKPASTTPAATDQPKSGSSFGSFVKNAAANISNALQPKTAPAPASAPAAPVAGALGFDPAK